MNSYERFLAAMQGKPVDRIPVACWLGKPLLLSLTPGAKNFTDLYKLWSADPGSTIIALQERLGLDPMVITYTEHIGEIFTWSSMLFTWTPDALANWQERREVVGKDGDYDVVRRTFRTPGGEVALAYRLDDGVRTAFEYLLKQESDLDLLQYRPDPALMNVDALTQFVRKVNKRAVIQHCFPGTWDEACDLRGVTTLSTDVYDRPEWVHAVMRHITDYHLGLIKRLGETGIESVNYNETWVGFGLSPKVYEKFILPYEIEEVRAFHAQGILVNYHNCGRATKLLELHAQTGADSIERLAPKERSGDTDLADAKKRIGDKIVLFGGFNENVIYQGTTADIEAEVKRCIDAAGHDGRYMLGSAGQIMRAAPGTIETMVAAAKKYGTFSA